MRIPRIRLGPGTVVAAAFIGPGTLTTATVAGVSYGNTLLWALVFSTLAPIVLQEMAARLGVIGGLGLGEAIRQRFERKLVRYASAALVIGAIVLGNAAYQTGNLLGGALGIAQLVGGSRSVWGSLLGLAAFVLLWSGRYRWIERVLVAMVAIMGAVFFATAIAVRADPASLARGLVPTGFADPDAMLVALGLVGTTVVPYNLFLHSSAVRERWRGEADLVKARIDTVLSVTLGGLISIAVLLTAAALPAGLTQVGSAADMARALEVHAGINTLPEKRGERVSLNDLLNPCGGRCAAAAPRHERGLAR